MSQNTMTSGRHLSYTQRLGNWSPTGAPPTMSERRRAARDFEIARRAQQAELDELAI